MSPNFHPWFPKYNEPYWKEYQDIVNLDEWEGVAGKPATKVARIIDLGCLEPKCCCARSNVA